MTTSSQHQPVVNLSTLSSELPSIIAGPVLRKIDATSACFWLACSKGDPIDIQCALGDVSCATTQEVKQFHMGTHLWICLATVTFETPLAEGDQIEYSVSFRGKEDAAALAAWHQTLCYPNETKPTFVYQPRVRGLLHGSCRKPHHRSAMHPTDDDCGDGLATADTFLSHTQASQWPSFLVMSGDQIYADDVAGPMLYAIHQVIHLLGLPDEAIGPLPQDDFSKLHHEAPRYYQRDTILPKTPLGKRVKKQLFSGVKKPIFTSDTSHNHLMTLSEFVAMYLLVWSPELWRYVDLTMPPSLNEPQQQLYQEELTRIIGFQASLKQVRRVMAHLPCAMMFDDHDVTDDWNLTAGWEQAAYEHPMSKRIIGNALIGYFLCQGWGNQPSQFDDAFLEQMQQAFSSVGESTHDDMIDALIRYDQWHYVWETHPPLVVLDTRTQRWRSERDIHRPSGLMDWEALTDLQHELRHRERVLLVSPAPIFGVKLIEATQKVFTWLGKPLLVDAENWMAHAGSAYALMNLFKHPKTPRHFVILSGDVHYSFAYHIDVRGLKSSPDIWQITSSGFRNEFPDTLLSWFDRLNRWLYAPWSPLNLWTKRRDMWVAPYKPEHREKGERLLNGVGVGWVLLDEQGAPKQIAQLLADGRKVRFLKSGHE